MKFQRDGNPASEALVRLNGNGTRTHRVYQDVADRRLAEKTQGSDAPPSLTYHQVTVDED